MDFTRIKTADISLLKVQLLRKQNYSCAICGIDLQKNMSNACVDHDHKTGVIRGVLCRNCNRGEGKVLTVATTCKRQGTPIGFLIKLLQYWTTHSVPQTNLYHPTHKTADEKRLLANKKARDARAKKKGRDNAKIT